MTAVVSLGLVMALAWVLTVIVTATLDAHVRGKARVMRGTSWTPKTRSEQDAA